MTKNPKTPKSAPKVGIVEECKELMQTYLSNLDASRKEQMLDMQYIALEQFTSDEIQDRANDGRPSYVIDRINPTLNVVVNEQRENLPAAQISPAGDNAEVDTAQVIEGLIRSIEQGSNASEAVANAAYYQAAVGEGYFRLASRYIDEASFDQELVFKSIDNPFSVLFDPASVEPDGKDADAVLIVKDLTPYEYRNRWGESKLAEVLVSGSLASVPGMVSWGSMDMVRVVEYWKRVYVPKTLYLVDTINVETGEVLETVNTTTKPTEEEVDTGWAAQRLASLQAEREQGVLGEPVTIKVIKQERKTQELTVKMYLINGLEVLQETEWPGRYIPIIPVRGDFIYSNEKRIVRGIVRPMRDAQKIYNLTTNAQIETIALAPKAPFITYAGATEGFEDMWETANSKAHAVLYVKPTVEGTQVPIPQRNNAEPAIQAIAATRAGAAEDLKVTSGVPNAAFGISQSEESGKAILARQNQARTTNAHYSQNVARSYKHAIRILVDILPHYYNTDRMIQIVRPDGKQELVAISHYAESPVIGDLGTKKKHDLTVGKYEVVVDSGKSYSTRRKEAVDSMLALAASNPANVELYEDLLVKEMDWPGAPLVAKRLKAALAMKFPGLLEATDESEDGIDDAVKAALANKKAQNMEAGLTQAIEIGEDLKRQLELLKTENKTLRMQNDVELQKAQLTYDIKVLEMQQQEQVAVQNAMIAAADYKLKKAQLSIDASKAANTVLNDEEDRSR